MKLRPAVFITTNQLQSIIAKSVVMPEAGYLF